MAGDIRIDIQPLKGGDADGLAQLRVAAHEGGLPARLGAGAVAAYFRAAAADPDTFGFVARAGGAPVGYVLCTTAAVRLQRAAVRSNASLWLRGAAIALRDPAFLRAAGSRLASIIRPNQAALATGIEPSLRLLDIAVAADARQHGVGRALMQAAVQKAHDLGHPEIGLSVMADNGAALRLYERFGFAPGARYMRPDGATVQTMRLALGPPAASSAF